MVHRPGEVLVEDERPRPPNFAEAANKRSGLPFAIDELRRRGFSDECETIWLGPFFTQWYRIPLRARGLLSRKSTSFCTMGAPPHPESPRQFLHRP